MNFRKYLNLRIYIFIKVSYLFSKWISEPYFSWLVYITLISSYLIKSCCINSLSTFIQSRLRLYLLIFVRFDDQTLSRHRYGFIRNQF